MPSDDDIILARPRQQNWGRISSDEEFPELAKLELESSDDDSSNYEGSGYSESDEEHEIEPYDMKNLPQHACKYCGIHDSSAVARCTECNRWFCNSRMGSQGGSHIIQHLVRAKHKEIVLHADSAIGDSPLECYHCGNKNIFLLGFIPAKADSVVVLLCRQPCASRAGKDSNWDLESWTPLINQRALLDWLVQFPSERELLRARKITSDQIIKLEELWKTNASADLEDLQEQPSLEIPVERVKLTYESAYEFHSIMAPLVTLEAEQDKAIKEAQRQDSVSIRWDIGLNMKRVAWILLPTNRDSDLRVAPGDEVRITHKSTRWQDHGHIIKSTTSSEEIAVEMKSSKSTPSETHGYSVEFVWRPTPYERMLSALRALALDDGILEPAILNEILGQGADAPELPVTLPKKISAPGLPELNHSQAHAVRHVLSRPLSLIQGPPGTGKTVTSATIIYHLAKMGKTPILVCAPSNVAVDHLTEKIHQTGLRVVRVTAKWREDIDNNISFLTLSNQLRNFDHPELKKLIKLKEELGELSSKDERKFYELKYKAERKIVNAAQVICTTSIGAGAPILAGMKFSAVLLDEATQAVEPEALIPLIHRPKQVVLVGDHRQLGPVVLCKKAVKAGFNQSLFERLINLGIRPVRLQVQYRMHPCLAEFPSNMFYDGSLQNGVTASERSKKTVDFPWPFPERPMIFLASVGTEELSSSGTSFLNRTEASQCEKIVTSFLKNGVLPSQIGVITPYEGQRAFLQYYLQASGTLRKELYSEIEIASVDAFQGREKDYIILSCVRSNDSQSIGFLSDARRLNVALTRAKYGIIILGNPKVLTRNHLWHHLVSHFKERNLLLEGTVGNLRPSLLQLAKPRPLSYTDLKSAPSSPTMDFNFPSTNTISIDTISQSGFDTISLSGYSAFSHAAYSQAGSNHDE